MTVVKPAALTGSPPLGMPKRVTLPTALGPNFSVADARAAGLGNGRIRGADLVSPYHGVRAVAGAEPVGTTEELIRRRAREYAPRLRPGQFFCEVTALALLGVDLPSRADDGLVHVGVVAPRRAPRARGVLGHEFAAPTVIRALGVPVSFGPEAWAQASARLPFRDLVLIGDGLVRRKNPLCDRTELSQTVQMWRGKRGFRRIIAADGRVRAGTDSIKESEVCDGSAGGAGLGVRRGEFLDRGQQARRRAEVVRRDADRARALHVDAHVVGEERV